MLRTIAALCVTAIASANYGAAVDKMNFDDVRADLKALMGDSQQFYPADYNNYGPFFIRLAWHCAGSYRISDGRGGCNGGRIRFNPELSWDDNANLNHALRLLWPIKMKYGEGLSWGDLIVLSGDTAIEHMGGPILGFCAGRIDSVDGSESHLLGPNEEQVEITPCEVDGDCKSPLGPTTLQLIYVNPEGPMGKPDKAGSAPQIRDTFQRMAMNDTETVALVGGGHAFGKTHGSCDKGAGPSPLEDPANPYPGLCGPFPERFTSGFEGPWTSNPINWDNEYFHNLLNYEWEVHTGPGGHKQWKSAEAPKAPNVQLDGTQDLMMLTADLALVTDPEYKKIVETFAKDQAALDTAFSHAWYKLMTRGMGPVTRCAKSSTLPKDPLPDQLPLPAPPAKLANFKAVKKAIQSAIKEDSAKIGQFVALAKACADAYRGTDLMGGCDGARIRLSPQKDWEQNKGMDKILADLQPIKDEFGDGLSWADLIVLAGTTAVTSAGGKQIPFCGGRTDAPEGEGGPEYLNPYTINSTDPLLEYKYLEQLSGLKKNHFLALMGSPTSPEQAKAMGYSGTWTTEPEKFSNEYFVTLLSEEWEPVNEGVEYKAKGKDIYMTPLDLAAIWDPATKVIVEKFAESPKKFMQTFKLAWIKRMNQDRFEGPTGNVCRKKKTKAKAKAAKAKASA